MLIRIGAMPEDIGLAGSYSGVIDGRSRGGIIMVEDALITLDQELASAAKDLVALAPFELLVEAA